ncbi:MAG TPA: Gfo/Idh/MocA family oxidoreductase [Verrucomicrobiota bacterium]|nr:Gfo/Idh/MocA family oxidoreductase [Verrucomicrobiota bacterium]HNT15349.1 Gfo/Idh/MocA family oxidoreductase [Verrucomicrobiota bacterium]
MSTNPDASGSTPTTRRDFIKQTSTVVAASALAGLALPHVHAAGNDTLQVAFIGCGGRGTDAAGNALSVRQGGTKLVAMADILPERLSTKFAALKQKFGDKVDVPDNRRFLGFDAYREAMDVLRPGDIVILTTPPAFRWVHFTHAIERGLNVFMEKPVVVDGPGGRRMLKLAEAAKAKNLKVGVGLNSRHARHLQQLAERIHDGAIGEIVLQRGYRMHGPVASFHSLPKPDNVSELLYQIQRFHSFIWASGGCFSDFYIHIIDHLGWMKNSWPVKAQALGGRHYKLSPEGLPYVDQNFDTYSVEYTYSDGTKFYFDGRCMTGCWDNFSSYIHGTKGSAIVAKSGDCGGPSSIYKGQSPKGAERVWTSTTPPGEDNWYQNEWNDLVEAIRADQPYNEVERGVTVSLVSAMGRMAAHTGQEITFEDMLNCEHEMAPGIDKFTYDSPAPVQADAHGRYPVPEPGIKTTREY